MSNSENKGLGREVQLGATGLKVMRMGMGGIPIQRLDVDQADRLLENAVGAGINFFDTARIYTDSESKFGRVLSRYRGQVVIASKSFSRGAAAILHDIDSSLAHLKTDYIDIYQCHNIAGEDDLAKVLADDGALAGLVKAREQGKIRHIGLSGHKPRIVQKALSAFPFATIQIPCNFMETDALADLMPLAKKLQTGVIAMKPIGGGNIKEINLNFRFIFNQGIDVAIPGMDSEKQVAENVAALENLSPLAFEETARLQKEKDRLGDRFCRRCEYCMPCPQGLPISFLHVLKNYYFLYDLQDWVWERINSLAKTYKDCAACGECVKKCPYHLNMPEIFRTTWEKMLAAKAAKT
jgi:predicted aldo/keto reductase-like oxidoreductase